MMLTLLGTLVLVALAAFILWDSRRLRGSTTVPISRGQMSRGYRPGANVAWKTCLGLSLVVASLGVLEVFEPRQPPFSGKLSLFFQLAHALLGARGPALLWFGLEALLFVGAMALRRGTISKL